MFFYSNISHLLNKKLKPILENPIDIEHGDIRKMKYDDPEFLKKLSGNIYKDCFVTEYNYVNGFINNHLRLPKHGGIIFNIDIFFTQEIKAHFILYDLDFKTELINIKFCDNKFRIRDYIKNFTLPMVHNNFGIKIIPYNLMHISHIYIDSLHLAEPYVDILKDNIIQMMYKSKKEETYISISDRSQQPLIASDKFQHDDNVNYLVLSQNII